MVREIIERHPRSVSFDRALLVRCIDGASTVPPPARAVPTPASASPRCPSLCGCVGLNLDCADVCDTTGRVVTRQTEPDLRVVRVAIEACIVTRRACADECDRHAAHHDHCRVCAEVCRRCEQACSDLLASIGDQ